jgi:hypothetical protein
VDRGCIDALALELRHGTIGAAFVRTNTIVRETPSESRAP